MKGDGAHQGGSNHANSVLHALVGLERSPATGAELPSFRNLGAAIEAKPAICGLGLRLWVEHWSHRGLWSHLFYQLVVKASSEKPLTHSCR